MSKYYITMSKTKHLIVLGIAIVLMTGMSVAQTYPGEVNVEDEDVTDLDPYDFPEASSIDADAGTIYDVELSTEMPTDHWTGLFGSASGELILGYNENDGNGDDHVLYNWDAEGALVFAVEESQNEPTWEDLEHPGEKDIVIADIDGAESDSYEETFGEEAENGAFNSDALGLEDIDAMTAETEGGRTTYHLSDDGEGNGVSVFATDVEDASDDNPLFNGEESLEDAYEMILPVNSQASSEYNLYVELK